MNKFCPKCNKYNEFGKNRASKDGLYHCCKICVSERNKKWRLENPEKIKAGDQAYREANRDRAKARNRVYCKANPGKVNANTAMRKANQRTEGRNSTFLHRGR